MKRRLMVLMSLVLVVGLTTGMSYYATQSAGAAAPGINVLVTPDYAGTWTNYTTQLQSSQTMSGDGRYVVFYSENPNKVSGDTNGTADVFVRDTLNNTTTMVDVSTAGVQADTYAGSASISYDGRFVVFASQADNLVSGVTSTTYSHVYIRDMVNQTTSIVDTSLSGTIASFGANTPSLSADGRFVAFSSRSSNLVSGFSTGNQDQIYLKDMETGAIKPVSVTSAGVAGNYDSGSPSISCDGNTIAFESKSTNLAGGSGGATSGRYDVYLVRLGWSADKMSNLTGYSSYGIYAGHYPQVSCDGNKVLFVSSSTDIISPATLSGDVNAYEYDRLTGRMTLVSVGNGGAQQSTGSPNNNIYAAMSGDGRYVVFTTSSVHMDPSFPHANAGTYYDVYVRDVRSGTTQLESITAAGQRSGWVHGAMVGISPDESKVVFRYDTPDPMNTYKELITGVHTNTTNVYTNDLYEAQTGL